MVADGKTYDNSTDVTRYLLEHAPKTVQGSVGNPTFVEKLHESNIDPGLILLAVVCCSFR